MYKIILLSLFVISTTFAQKSELSYIKSHYSKKNYKEVIKLCSTKIDKLSHKDSLYKHLLNYRSSSYMKVLDYTSAIEDFKILLLIDKKEINHYTNLAYAYTAIGDTINEVFYLHKAFEVNPKDPLLVNNLVFKLSELEMYDKGIFYANKGLKLSTNDTLTSLLLNNRGFCFLQLKKFDNASDDFKKSIKLFPSNSLVYYNRALLNIELNNLKNVCPDLLKSKELGNLKITESLLTTYCK